MSMGKAETSRDTTRRGPWSSEEDKQLRQLVEKYGKERWTQVAKEFPTRSAKQCRERWHQNLKPGLRLEPITPEEGKLIEKMVEEQGTKWATIARALGDRSDNMVKNWWNGGNNKRKRTAQSRAQQMHQRSGRDIAQQPSSVPQRPLPSAPAPQAWQYMQQRPNSNFNDQHQQYAPPVQAMQHNYPQPPRLPSQNYNNGYYSQPQYLPQQPQHQQVSFQHSTHDPRRYWLLRHGDSITSLPFAIRPVSRPVQQLDTLTRIPH